MGYEVVELTCEFDSARTKDGKLGELFEVVADESSRNLVKEKLLLDGKNRLIEV